MSDDQITIRESGDGYSLEFSYNEEFIGWLKGRFVPAERSYDPDTHIWRVRTNERGLNAIIGVAVQKFRHAVLWHRNEEGKLAMKNLKTGVETVQEELFS